MRPESRFLCASNWPSIGKTTKASQFVDMASLSIFLCYQVSLVAFSYWPKFHVNIITVFRVMTNFLNKGLTRNLEIRNTPVWIFPNIWRLCRFRDTKFCTNVSNEMLLNATRSQGHRFYRFWVIKGKLTGGKITPTSTHTHTHTHTQRLRLSMYELFVDIRREINTIDWVNVSIVCQFVGTSVNFSLSMWKDSSFWPFGRFKLVFCNLAYKK